MPHSQGFGVELHAEEPASILGLEGLDEPVDGYRGRYQAGSEGLHALVMKGVDEYFRLSLGQTESARSGEDFDAMPEFVDSLILRRVVLDRPGKLSPDVLIERAAERDIEELMTAADSEYGHPAPSGFDREGHLEFVPLDRDGAETPQGLFAVTERRDISSAGKEKSVYSIEDIPRIDGHREGRQHEGKAAGLGDRAGIVEIEDGPARFRIVE